MSDETVMAMISRLASATGRCVARSTLLAAGLSSRSVDGLIRRGFLTPVFRGVYAIGVTTLSHREFLHSCVLHAAPAFLSSRSGLELRKVLPIREGRATVTTLRRNLETPVETLLPLTNGQTGKLYVITSTTKVAPPVEVVDGFETPTLPRTLIDFAGREGRSPLQRAWREADYRGLLDPDAIRAELDAGHRHAGSRLVRERLEVAFPITTPGTDLRSRDGEFLFLEILREAGLPLPQANVKLTIGGEPYMADFLYAELGLVVEIDGGQHDLPERVQEDKLRDNEFFVAGLDVLRFATVWMEAHRLACAQTVGAAIERQRRRAA
jgi:very-short-patch-repair endonuclease